MSIDPVTMTAAELNQMEREAFERGRKAGKSEAALETEYGSFDGLVQAVIAAARDAAALPGEMHKGPHSYGNAGSVTSCIRCDAARMERRHGLRAAIAAYDAKYPR